MLIILDLNGSKLWMASRVLYDKNYPSIITIYVAQTLHIEDVSGVWHFLVSDTDMTLTHVGYIQSLPFSQILVGFDVSDIYVCVDYHPWTSQRAHVNAM